MTDQLAIPSVPNLRDMGGHATRDGARVRSGLLYRSEQLGHVSDAGMAALAALELKKIYDLRTVDERAALPDMVPPGAQDVVVDVLAGEQQTAPAQLLNLLHNPQQANAELGGGKVVVVFEKLYRDIVSLPTALAGFGRMFRELAEPTNLPALFHCTTGKDRTGWAAAALLALCGVPDDVVMQDYLLSNDYILPEYASAIEQAVAAGMEEDILLSILGVRREYLDASFQEMRARFGTIEDYFAAGLGIDRAGQEALRARFLEP